LNDLMFLKFPKSPQGCTVLSSPDIFFLNTVIVRVLLTVD